MSERSLAMLVVDLDRGQTLVPGVVRCDKCRHPHYLARLSLSSIGGDCAWYVCSCGCREHVVDPPPPLDVVVKCCERTDHHHHVTISCPYNDDHNTPPTNTYISPHDCRSHAGAPCRFGPPGPRCGDPNCAACANYVPHS